MFPDNFSPLMAVEATHSSGLFSKHPINMVRGQGALLFDDRGRQFIDCMGGHGVANIGHAHPRLIEAITQQAQNLIILPETYFNDARARLLEKITTLVLGLERAFFCNSGAESIEAAIKFARLSTGRTQIIAAMRGFHGRTFGALSATWNKGYRHPFEPLVPDFLHIPFNNVEAIHQAIGKETAAVILEVIQGEGGVHPADLPFIQAARDYCTENGALLIIDEVQTGYGRTGKLFAFQHYDILPDMLCIAKGMAGGIPMGAVLFNTKIENLAPGLHGNTFGGNPLACAAASAVLEIIESENLCQQCTDKGTYLFERLSKLQSPLIRDIRGKGLMVGIELKQKVAPYTSALENLGVLTLPTGLTVIRLLPPLVISYAQLDQVVDGLSHVLQ